MSTRRAVGSAAARVSSCLCAFSTRTIAASTMAPIAIAIPPRLMMLELMPRNVHRDEGERDRDRKRQDRAPACCAKWSRKTKITRLTTTHLLEQRVAQRLDRAVDQLERS